MTAILHYLVTSSATVSPFSPVMTLPPILGSAVDCDFDAFTQAELLRICAKAYPQEYLAGLMSSPNGGYELFQAACKVNERVSIAVARFACCHYIGTAHDGAKAEGAVEFYRTETTAGAYVIPHGSIVRTWNNKEFLTLADVLVGALDLGPFTVGIEAVTEGYAYNVTGVLVTAGNELIAGEIDDIKSAKLVTDLVSNTPTVDLSLRVRNIIATTGGQDKCLEAIGQDLGLPRLPNEEIEAYRYRIASTPDAVSPDAIRRGANAILAPYDLGICLREVGTPLLPGFFYDAGSSADAVQDPRNNYAYDMDFDLRPEDRFKLWLSYTEMRGFFLVGVPPIVETTFPGLVYDTASTDPYSITNAYDTEALDAQFAAYDGGSTLASSVYQAIWNSINDRHAGGVGFDLYVEQIGCF